MSSRASRRRSHLSIYWIENPVANKRSLWEELPAGGGVVRNAQCVKLRQYASLLRRVCVYNRGHCGLGGSSWGVRPLHPGLWQGAVIMQQAVRGGRLCRFRARVTDRQTDKQTDGWRLEVMTSALSPALRAGFRACLCRTSVSLASLARPSALPSLFAPWGVLQPPCAV